MQVCFSCSRNQIQNQQKTKKQRGSISKHKLKANKLLRYPPPEGKTVIGN